MISIKPGVDLTLLRPQMALATQTLASALQQFGCDLMITSGSDGEHIRMSKHYSGEALDYRTNTIPVENLSFIVDMVSDALGSQFDVVLEPDHLHVEFDPH